jgi:uncharacterized protein (TIGR03437 family)
MKLLVFLFAASLYGQTKLTSGTPVQFLINTIYAVVLNGKNGYVIPIPADPIQLEVNVEIAPATSGVYVFVRCGEDIGGANDNDPVYDTMGGTANGAVTVVLNRPAGGADGNCYVAMEPTSTGPSGSTGGRLTATIKPFPSGTPVTVPSLASIYLAGQPPGTKLGTLSVPSNSPPQVPISLTAGQGLNILAAGLITAPNQLGGIPPDGSILVPFGDSAGGTFPAALGLSEIGVRDVSLVGVFVGDTIDSTAPLGLAFGNDLTAAQTLYPALQQVFYIGNGVNSNGQDRAFVVPPGATRLFLASISGGFSASGSFTASVSPASIPSTAAPTNPIIISAMANLFLADQPNGIGFGSKIASSFTPYSVPPKVPIALTAGQNLHIIPFEDATLGSQSSTKGVFGLSTLPPANGLDGVFVGDTINTAATPAGLDGLVADQTVAPLLQQVFYVGNGLTNKGLVKDFTVPAGATRLLLANAGGGTAASGFIVASVSPDDANAPVINAGGIVNNAGFPTGPVAPGSMVAIFGSNFGPQTFPTSVPLPTTLGGTQIFFDATPAPLVFVSPGQVVAQVPMEMYGQAKALVTPMNNGIAGLPVVVNLETFAPGIFTTGSGDPVIIDNNTGQLVSPSAPASVGDVLIIWATGLGPTLLDPATGHPAPDTASPALLPVRVTLKGASSGATMNPPLQYAGLAPGFVALYQINMQIPATAPTGTVIVTVSSPALAAADPVTIGIK